MAKLNIKHLIKIQKKTVYMVTKLLGKNPSGGSSYLKADKVIKISDIELIMAVLHIDDLNELITIDHPKRVLIQNYIELIDTKQVSYQEINSKLKIITNN